LILTSVYRSVPGLLAVALALFAGLSLGFLFAPDPTGIAPVLVGLALTVVLAPFLYRSLRSRA
jgi:hypothetical protein